MSEPFVAEIRMFPYTFTPNRWAYCNGQPIPIAQNQMLYAVIGTIYGGDGQTFFHLPNLSGRTPAHAGSAPGLTQYVLGEKIGAAEVYLDSNNLPTHTHTTYTELEFSEKASPTNNVLGVLQDANGTGNYLYTDANTPRKHTPSNFLKVAGQSQPHENEQPYLVMSFFIALDGIFPAIS